MTARVLTIATRKGGAGKSKVTTNIGADLAGRGHRVLLVDLDPQATTTADCGVEPELGYSIGELINTPPPYTPPTLAQIIQETEVPNLSVVPSIYRPLEAAEATMTGAKGAMSISKTVVEPLREDYDFILIDTPPRVGNLTTAAIHASDYAVPLVSPDMASYEGAYAYLELVRDVNSMSANPTGIPFWIAANWEEGYAAQAVLEALEDDEDVTLLDTRLPHSKRAGSAPQQYAAPMVAVWPRYPFSLQVTALVDEILEVLS